MARLTFFLPPGSLTPGVTYPVRQLPNTDGFTILAANWGGDVVTDQYGDAILDQDLQPIESG